VYCDSGQIRERDWATSWRRTEQPFRPDWHSLQRVSDRRANDSRIVTIGQLILFSTKTGDAWLLDPADHLAARLARQGESEPIQIEETDTTFAIGWKGRYRIEGPAFVYSDEDTGRVATILVPCSSG
jgi:hypothetical protein